MKSRTKKATVLTFKGPETIKDRNWLVPVTSLALPPENWTI